MNRAILSTVHSAIAVREHKASGRVYVIRAGNFIWERSKGTWDVVMWTFKLIVVIKLPSCFCSRVIYMFCTTCSNQLCENTHECY